MAMEMSKEAVSTLNDLIETLKDGKNGFETAASDVKDARVKAVFQEFAQQRSQLTSELQSEVRKLGGDPETSGSASASMHRGWMNIKSALGGGEKSILNEAERGEDIAVQSYEKALSQNLPADVSSVVRRQYDQVKQAHDRVRDLRDSWK
jgi:uncharacterized protein (TIGR02284 family)